MTEIFKSEVIKDIPKSPEEWASKYEKENLEAVQYGESTWYSPTVSIKTAFLDGYGKGIEEQSIKDYQAVCDYKQGLYEELLNSFSEQLGIMDKEDDELFSLAAIKAILKEQIGIYE